MKPSGLLNLFSRLLLGRVSRWTRYLSVIVIACAAVIVTALLHNWTGTYSALMAMLAVVFISLLANMWIALSVGAVLSLMADYLLIPPVGQVLFSPEEMDRFGIFLVAAFTVSVTMTALKSAYRRMWWATRDAEMAKSDAVRASEAKTQFLSNISHEIRTPLNGVIGMTQLMAKTDLNEDQARFLRTIRASSQQLLGLLNDVLDLGKIEAGKIDLDIVPFDIEEISSDLYEWFSPVARQKGLEVRVTVDVAPGLKFCGDAHRLKQVLSNLLSNAIKFTRKGTVALSIQSTLPDDHGIVTLKFKVADTGIGMSEEIRSKIFESFYQANASTTRRFGGSGLGLAIAKQLVDLMHGEISVTSAEDVGTEFHVSLVLPCVPNVGGKYQPHDAGNMSPVVSVGQKRMLRKGHFILIAEDNEVSQTITRAVLESVGYEVDVAPDGVEVLQAVSQRDYSLILMDCQMPRMDGYEATQELRKAGHAVPIIALTAHAFSEDRERCLSVGMSDYLSKPLSEERLVSAVDSFVFKQVGGEKNKRRPDVTAVPVEATEAVMDFTKIQRLEEIDRMARRGLVAKLITLYHRDAPESLQAIRKAVQEQDRVRLHQVVHKFKTSNSNLGLNRIFSLLERLENKDLDIKDYGPLVDRLEREVSLGIQELEKLRPLASVSAVKNT